MAAPTGSHPDAPTASGGFGTEPPRPGRGNPSWSVPAGGGPQRDPAKWFDDDVVPVQTRQPAGHEAAPGPAGPPSPAGPPGPAGGLPRGQAPPSRGPRPPARRAPSGAQGRERKARGAPPRGSRASGAGGAAPSPRRGTPRQKRRRPADDWSRVAPVYDVDGPRVRYGVLWFVAVVPAVLASPITAAVAYAAAAGLAARQTARAWRAVSWQADLAAALAAIGVLSSIAGTGAALFGLGAVAAVALMAGLQAPVANVQGAAGRIGAAGVLLEAVLPVALAGAAVVLVRNEFPAAAVILVGLVSAYEMGDFLVGSAASNPVEGPLAGGAAVIVVGFPLALLLVEPFDVMGATMLGIAAVCCPVGQWLASAVLPRPGAHAPALRRIDTLLLLAPVWAVAAGVF